MEETLDQIKNLTNQVQNLESIDNKTSAKISEIITSIKTRIGEIRKIEKNKNQLLVQLDQVNSKIEQFP